MHVKNTFYTTTITVIIVSLIISLALAVQIATSRQQSIQQINTSVANLSHTLDVYTEGIMRQSEMLITTVSDIIEIYGMTPQQATNIQHMIHNQDNLLTQINNVVVYNAQGNIFTACSAANFFAPKRIKLCTAASVRNTAIAHCANLNASQLQDASDLGIATDEEIKQLTDWKKISGAADAC